jgi:hypothetical protein
MGGERRLSRAHAQEHRRARPTQRALAPSISMIEVVKLIGSACSRPDANTRSLTVLQSGGVEAGGG